MDLFSTTPQIQTPQRKGVPLADRVRPRVLEEVVGQPQLTEKNSLLAKMVKEERLSSFILWGPPGSGKTTIAHIVAEHSRRPFVPFSALLSGIKEVRSVMQEAEQSRKRGGLATVVFVDEIHRFNKAQQDAFLPFVERGDIILIGATTENPSFEINSALLSRLTIFVLNPLRIEDVTLLLQRALHRDEEIQKFRPNIAEDTLTYLASRVPGDARAALNVLENSVMLVSEKTGRAPIINRPVVDRALAKVALLYDKAGEEHFNIISALHKSMRNGDADAAVYWLGRMLEAGEDPLYVARRMIRFASEDVGNADPLALSMAVAAKDAVHFLGIPEGKLALAQLATYLAAAPKSNAVYIAYNRVERDLREGRAYPVPMEVRNAPTSLMKELGYGKGYEYAHDFEEKTAPLACLPGELKGKKYYEPTEEGLEKTMGERLDTWKRVRDAGKPKKL